MQELLDINKNAPPKKAGQIHLKALYIMNLQFEVDLQL